MKTLTVPVSNTQELAALAAGDMIYLSGTLYTARDAAHQRLCALLDGGEDLPMPLTDQAVYYAGPCPAPPGHPIGSAGPTTSSRMDAYAPQLIAQGLRIMIGKGPRSAKVMDAMRMHGAVYLAAIGGAGALMAHTVKEAECIAFPELGAEAIYQLRVEDMPLVVAIDLYGNNLYETGPERYHMRRGIERAWDIEDRATERIDRDNLSREERSKRLLEMWKIGKDVEK